MVTYRPFEQPFSSSAKPSHPTDPKNLSGQYLKIIYLSRYNEFMRLGLPELLIILTILLLLFGAKRLPSLAKSLGKSTREFKSGLEEE